MTDPRKSIAHVEFTREKALEFAALHREAGRKARVRVEVYVVVIEETPEMFASASSATAAESR